MQIGPKPPPGAARGVERKRKGKQKKEEKIFLATCEHSNHAKRSVRKKESALRQTIALRHLTTPVVGLDCLPLLPGRAPRAFTDIVKDMLETARAGNNTGEANSRLRVLEASRRRFEAFTFPSLVLHGQAPELRRGGSPFSSGRRSRWWNHGHGTENRR